MAVYLGGNKVSLHGLDKISISPSTNLSLPVRFIDYDGTILCTYSVNNFLALRSMPPNPEHSGLIAQGWNWSLEDAKAQLTAYPEAGLTIGQMYITDDNKTRLYVHFEEGRLHPYLGICPNGTVVVDWGDNSTTSTLTGTSLTTVQHADHKYASAGDYVITLTASSGSFAFCGVSSAAYILKKDTSTTANIHRVYANCLQKVEIGNNVSIGTYAFNYCYSLTSITIPSGITSIGTYAFNYCYSLSSITIPSGITSIGTYTFYFCSSLASITIPNGVTSIESSAFRNCYLLVNITIPDGITSIGAYAFYCCSSLASIIIPDGVTSIGNYTFYYCFPLAKIIIPDGVTSFGDYVFSNCYSLASLTIPDGVTSIGNNTFNYCSSLVSITIPKGTTSIGNNAFANCNGVAEYHFLPTTPPTLGTTAFPSIQPDCVIYVPQGSLSAYQAATNWSDYASYMQEEPTT